MSHVLGISCSATLMRLFCGFAGTKTTLPIYKLSYLLLEIWSVYSLQSFRKILIVLDKKLNAQERWIKYVSSPSKTDLFVFSFPLSSTLIVLLQERSTFSNVQKKKKDVCGTI